MESLPDGWARSQGRPPPSFTRTAERSHRRYTSYNIFICFLTMCRTASYAINNKWRREKKTQRRSDIRITLRDALINAYFAFNDFLHCWLSEIRNSWKKRNRCKIIEHVFLLLFVHFEKYLFRKILRSKRNSKFSYAREFRSEYKIIWMQIKTFILIHSGLM